MYAAFSLALDESTDINDAAQHVMLIRAVTVGFDVVEELLHMASLSSTATGQDICEHVIRVVENFKQNPAKLSGLTTDGASSMTGRTNGFTEIFLYVAGALGVVVCHWSTRCSCMSLEH